MRDFLFITMLTFFILLLSSCQPEKMERPLVPYKEGAIRTDGYYFNNPNYYDRLCRIYFFSRNGTYRKYNTSGNFPCYLSDSVAALNWDNFNDNDISSGGFWQEDLSTVELLYWLPTAFVHKLVSTKVKVLDDTTFVMIDERFVHERADMTLDNRSDTFRFRKSSFKPDSLYFERQKAKGARHVP